MYWRRWIFGKERRVFGTRIDSDCNNGFFCAISVVAGEMSKVSQSSGTRRSLNVMKLSFASISADCMIGWGMNMPACHIKGFAVHHHAWQTGIVPFRVVESEGGTSPIIVVFTRRIGTVACEVGLVTLRKTLVQPKCYWSLLRTGLAQYVFRTDLSPIVRCFIRPVLRYPVGLAHGKGLSFPVTRRDIVCVLCTAKGLGQNGKNK